MTPAYFTIYLIGFSGVGKTTIGAKLADSLDAKFYDIDAEIVKHDKREIVDIFRVKGEEYFRYLEVEMVQKVSNRRSKRKVVALGGGAFESKEIRHCVKEHGVSIFLSACQQKLYKRMRAKIDRPLLQNFESKMTAAELKKQIQMLMKKRIKNYRTADITIAIKSKTVPQVVSEIKGKLT